MGITLPPPPDDAMAILTDGVTDLQSSDPTRAIGGSAPRAAPHPFPLYRLKLASIRAGSDPLRSAAQIGWRYLVERDDTPAVADLHEKSETGVLDFGQMATGPLADQLVAGANRAEALVGAQGGAEPEYEARILEVPALHVSALWLKNENPLFLVLLPEGSTEPLSAADFRAMLVAAAAELRQATRRRPE